MAYTHEQVATFLEEHWQGEKECPVCRSNKWTISEKPAELREYERGSLTIGGPVYPLVLVTCRVCGHTLLFNAIIMGIVEVPKQEPKAKQDAAPAQKGEKP